ncbi:MAG TPA: ABC transporter permease [Ideonella sp.]|uniref:ABC transporter permease n=1 Tax=Ideonella sp. TaxID=1929293 RepID=UPI002C0EAAE4|nr:ABC transporter permease [Ideonella sp.]HSI51681.1 ABC transporter permease [Ideonella sp.]
MQADVPTGGMTPGLWRVALARLLADRSALVAGALLLLVLLACAAAPLYAERVAHADPFRSNISGQVMVDGQLRDVIEASTEGLGLGQTPIGPTWQPSAYLLGADNQGRDVAARLLYGGRASLLIASGATLLSLLMGALLGIVAGYFGGAVDWLLSRVLDVLWAFPVYLLAISLSIVTIGSGLHLGPLRIEADSLWLPALIIGLVYLPYVARPVRAQALALRRSDFVHAAIGLGVPTHRILRVDILPNVATTLIVFVPLMMALNMLTESALSFLSIGVQAPNASWGTIIQDGLSLLYTRPMVALAPGAAIVLTVVALNLLGDALRDALDPRATFRVKETGT